MYLSRPPRGAWGERLDLYCVSDYTAFMLAGEDRAGGDRPVPGWIRKVYLVRTIALMRARSAFRAGRACIGLTRSSATHSGALSGERR
jgi:hypothetical protein